MKFRSCLIFFGLLVLLAVITSASEEENEIQELSERVVREAEADPGRRRKKGKKGKGKKRSKVSKTKKAGKKRNNDRKKKTTRRKTGCGRQADGKCLENAVTAMNRWLRVVSNYKKQSARIKGQKAVADKKKG